MDSNTKPTEKDPCNYCGKTLREQMKGCNEIACYRQFLPKAQEYPVIGQRVIFSKGISSDPGGSDGDIRTIKNVFPYPCDSEKGKKRRVLVFEEDTEKSTFTQVKCGWCSEQAIKLGRHDDVNLHTLPSKVPIHLDSEWEPYNP